MRITMTVLLAGLMMTTCPVVASSSPTPSPCDGTKTFARAGGAESASDTPRAIQLYQQAIEQITECLGDNNNSGAQQLALNSLLAQSHLTLAAFFTTAGNREDGAAQLMSAGGPMIYLCDRTDSLSFFDRTNLHLNLISLRRLATSYPGTFDFAPLERCFSATALK
jgi:hypothetical protein